MTKFNRKNKKSKTKKRKITKSKKLKGGGTSKKSSLKKSSSRRNFGKPTFPGLPELPLKLSLGKAKEAEEVIKKEKDLMEEYESYIKNKAIPQNIKQNREKGKYLSPLRNTATTDTHKVTNQLPRTPTKLFKNWKREAEYEQAALHGLTIDDSPLNVNTSPLNSIPTIYSP